MNPAETQKHVDDVGLAFNGTCVTLSFSILDNGARNGFPGRNPVISATFSEQFYARLVFHARSKNLDANFFYAHVSEGKPEVEDAYAINEFSLGLSPVSGTGGGGVRDIGETARNSIGTRKTRRHTLSTASLPSGTFLLNLVSPLLKTDVMNGYPVNYWSVPRISLYLFPFFLDISHRIS